MVEFAKPNCIGMKLMALAKKKSSARHTLTSQRKRRSESKFVVCVMNRGYPASLELHKIYRVVADKQAERDGDGIESAPDVAAYFGNPAFAGTGWSLALDLSGLSLGNHTVTAVGTDSAGATAPLSGAVNFSISN